MRHYFRLPTGHSHTVNTIVAEAYALVTPGTTATEDPARRSGAIAALRDLNAGLPANNGVVVTNPYVWLRRIDRIPFRIPDTPTVPALRPALANLKIHDLFALTSLSAEFVFSKLPGGTATLAQVQRLMDICRLMKVRGMSVGIATALRDHGTPIATPQAVYEASQSTIKSIIAAADPTMPASLKALRPAFMLQQNARRHAPRPAPGRTPRFIGGIRGAALAEELAFWQGEATSPVRDAAERTSAEVVAFLLQIQREIAFGTARVARGNGAAAYPHFRRVWTLLGNRARDLGIVAPSSPEVSGPSLETILTTCGALLQQLDPADAQIARQRLGAAPDRTGEGLQSLRMTDLAPASKSTVKTALGTHPLWALGRSRRRRAMTLLADKTVAQLGAPGTVFNLGFETTNPGARLAEIRPRDREVLVENIGAATVNQYSTQFGSEWAALEAELQLNTVQTIVGTSLGSPAPFANAVVTAAAAALYPSSLLTNLRAFDRFYAWRPSRRPSSPPRYVPINTSFSLGYRTQILAYLRDERIQDVWQFELADFADPIRFAFVLPALIARPLRNNLARTVNPVGHYEEVRHLQLGMAKELVSVESVVPATPLTQVISVGGLANLQPEVVCGTELVELMTDQVKLADEAYMKGDLEIAATAYEWVIAAGKQCPETAVAATYIQQLHAQLVAVAHASASTGVRSRIRVADWVVDHPATELVEPLFPGLFPSGGPSMDITRRYAERVPGAVSVRYYFRDAPIPGLGGGSWFDIGSALDETGGGNPFDQREDPFKDTDIITFEPPVYNFPPGGGGGGTDGPPGGGGGGAIHNPPATIDVSVQEMLVLHAATYLAQLNAGLNWLGLDPDAVPPWRFEYLVSQARYFAEKSDALQQRAMGLLQSAERSTLEVEQAEGAAALTAAGVEVAHAQESLAYAQLDAAIAAQEAAELANDHARDDRGWAVAGGIAAAAATGAAIGAAGGGVGAAVGAVVGVVVGVISTAQNYDRASETTTEAEAQLAIAEQQLGVAEEQVALAAEQTALAEMQAAQAADYLALLQGMEFTPAAYYELMNIVGTFASSYLKMANRLAFLAEKAYQFESRRYSSYIHQDYGAQDTLDGRFQSGTRLLTDLDALVHEQITATVDRYQLIKTTFSLLAWEPTSLALLQQIGQTVIRMDPQTLDLRFPGLYLHSLKRIEIEFDGLLPAEGVHAILRLGNNSFVRVPNDASYVPDPSLVTLDWAYPAATYSVGVEVGKTRAPFVLKPLLGVGFRQILSEYRRTQDSVVVAPPEGALDVFENLPTDLLFTLELPATGNGFAFANVTDVRVSLFFTAKYSDLLAQRQQAALVAAGRVSRAILLTGTTHAADDFAVFKATALDPKRRDVRFLPFDASSQVFPAHYQQRVLQNVQVALLGLTGTSMKVRFAGGAFPLAPVVDTSHAASNIPPGVPVHVPDGMLFTALGEVDMEVDNGTLTIYDSRAGTYPTLEFLVNAVSAALAANFENVVDTYVLKILPDNNADQCVRNDAGGIVETPATEAALAADATLTYTTGTWLHVEVRALVSLVPGTFRLIARQSTAGTHNVVAQLVLTPVGSEYLLQASILHGPTLTSLASEAFPKFPQAQLDAVYEVTLRVTGLVAELFIDRVPVTLTQGVTPVRKVVLPASYPVAGSVRLSALSNATPIRSAGVVTTRLRYDGTPIETSFDDPFDSLAAWTAAGTVTLPSVTRRRLDLGFVQDVLLQLDYTAAFDFPS